MKRILIVGPPGAGKSTFAIKLAERTGLPLFHLDALFWKPGWVMTDRDDFDAAQSRLIQNDRWIIDGNYARSLDLRLTRADTAIHLDFPRPLYLRRVLWRMISGYGRVRQDMADGCPERLDFIFMKWCWNYHRNHRPDILTTLDDFASRDGAELITRTDPRQLDQLLNELSERLTSGA